MTRLLLLVFLLTGSSVELAMAAQSDPTPPVQPEDTLQQPVRSFEALPLVLVPGQTVTVIDDQGRKTKGRLMSIADDEILVAARRYPFPRFRSRLERAFAEAAVARIELVDSTWNGALIGGAVGAAIVVPGIWSSKNKDSNLAPVYNFLFVPLAILAAAGIGSWVDSLSNETVYERRSESQRFTLAP
jgi:hypothetical protein